MTDSTKTCSSDFNVLDVGCGDSDIVHKFYSPTKLRKVDKKRGWDVMVKGLPKGKWDVVFANHVIEHVTDPDKFLEYCKEVMNPYTVLDIGTPNLCAWFNRILFLFGYLPHSYEVSYVKGFGRAFNWNDEEMGGHVRVFSVPALIQMLKFHNFKIVSVVGERSLYKTNWLVGFIDKVATMLSPELASSFRIKCTL